MKVSDLMWNMLSPPLCMACSKEMSVTDTAMFCYDCGKAYYKTGNFVCRVCGKPIGENADTVCTACKSIKLYIESNVSRYVYKGCIRDAVRNMKFNKQQWICTKFGNALAKTVEGKYADIDFDMVMYVPMTKLAESNRGFNQACEIAMIIAKKIKTPIVHNVLYKKIGTKTQSGLSRKERFLNVRDSFFVCNAEKLTDKVVLLIDDVYTTGATLNECARLLKKHGALAVYTATIATTVIE